MRLNRKIAEEDKWNKKVQEIYNYEIHNAVREMKGCFERTAL